MRGSLGGIISPVAQPPVGSDDSLARSLTPPAAWLLPLSLRRPLLVGGRRGNPYSSTACPSSRDPRRFRMVRRPPEGSELATRAYLSRFSPDVLSAGRSRETAGIVDFAGQLPQAQARVRTCRLSPSEAHPHRRLFALPIDCPSRRPGGRGIPGYRLSARAPGPGVCGVYSESLGRHLPWLLRHLVPSYRSGLVRPHLFSVAGLILILQLVRGSPLRWPSQAALLYAGLALLYDLVLPSYIEPLFNTVTPLPSILSQTP